MAKTSKLREKSESIKCLQTLRNIGPTTAEKLYSLGIKTPEQMRKSDPEELYERLNMISGGKVDRCVLYQFRGAVFDLPWPRCKNLIKEKGENKR
ncbi:MAG: helix-hairpin-helix domain-containing protein [Candidatus Hydrothermarchaeales archaeon]